MEQAWLDKKGERAWLDEFGQAHLSVQDLPCHTSFSQIPDLNFHVTHHAIAKYSALHAILAIAMREDMELHQVDIVGACLQGDLDEEIYMTPPAGLNIPGKKGQCLRLHKPLYGLKQAG
jgi:hypothetical protein